MKQLILLFTALATAAIAQGQVLEEIVAGREQRLEDSLKQLHVQRETIHAERLPLARALNASEARLAELESALARARRIWAHENNELTSLRARVSAQQQELDLVLKTLLPTHFSDYEAALSPGERQHEGEAIRAYNLFLEKPATTEADRLEAALHLMQVSFAQVEASIGGRRYPGKALTPDGIMRPGQFAQIGPLLYFINEDGDMAGVVQSTRNLHAQLHNLGTEPTRAITTLIEKGHGVLPIDLSLGSALALEQSRDTIKEHLIKGGIWIYPILLSALIATIVAIFKVFQIFSIRQPAPHAVHNLVKAIRAGDHPQAKSIAEAQPQPTREMLNAAAEHTHESAGMIEEAMYESMLAIQPRLERYLNVIAVTAAIAPLLGLLGTVTGIIKTFELMTIFGAGDPRPLISGISEALITTELGLILAIPALVLHALLSRKVAGTMARLERTAITLTNGLARTQSNPQAD